MYCKLCAVIVPWNLAKPMAGGEPMRRLLFFIIDSIYTNNIGDKNMPKPFMNYDEQLAQLKNKGLTINNEEFALSMLKKYSYYSLITGYKAVFKNKVNNLYYRGVEINDIIALYDFDKNLRETFLKYLISYEKTLGSHLSYYFCEKYGESQNEYLNIDNYDSTSNYSRKINGLIFNLRNRVVCNNSDYANIAHYQRRHHNVPLWVLVTTLSFGTKSLIYNVLHEDIRRKVAKEFDVDMRTLSQINYMTTKFRNVCAHGDRLFNRRMNQSIPDLPIHKKLGIEKVNQTYSKGKSDLFAIVIALKYVLNKSDFIQMKNELNKLINDFLKKTSFVDEETILIYMGFPNNWKTITRYKNN